MSDVLLEEEYESEADAPGGRRFGMVVFDDEKDPRAGWLSIEGSEAKRIEGTHELANDVIWWTNIGYQSFFLTTEIWRVSWLKHDAYLIVKPQALLQEWGIDPASTPPNYMATFCSTFFHRVMTLAFRLAKECEPKLRMVKMFEGKSLREDLRRLLPKAEYPTGEAGSIMRSGQVYAEFTRTSVRGVRGSKNIVLRRPRISYAFEMLQTPLPKGPFEFKSRSDLRNLAQPMGNDKVVWARNCAQPCMVEVGVEYMDPEANLVYAFGNSLDKDTRISRSWIAHPEFMVMSTFSKLDVKNAYMGREYGLITKDLPEPVKRFLSSKHSDFSWCAGVLSENLWRAASLGEGKNQRPGERPEPEERAQTSWRGAWIKAADKASMFMSAMQLNDMGYPPMSYGNGWISCQIPEDQIKDFIRDGLTIGLIPKFSDVPEGMYDSTTPIPWGGDKRSMMLAQLTMSRSKHMLWNLDKLPLLDSSQRDVMLKKMISAHRNKEI